MAKSSGEVPHFIPERDELRARSSARKKNSAVGLGGGVVIFISLLVSVAAFVAVYLLWQELNFSQRVFRQQQMVLGELQQNNSVTAEDLTAFKAELDKSLLTVDSALTTLRKEVVAIKSELNQASASLPAFQEGFQKYADTLQTFQEISSRQGQNLEQLKGQLNTLLQQVQGSGLQLEALRETLADGGSAGKKIEAMQQEISSLSGVVTGFGDQLTLSGRRIESNEEWLESINQWRLELNNRMLRLQALVESTADGDDDDSGFASEPL